MRLSLTKQAIDHSSHPEAIKDYVRHFLTGYKACADNRNILMHSMAMFVWSDPNAERCPAVSQKQPDAIAFQKSPKGDPYTINLYEPTLTELRGVADAIKAFDTYGDRLYWHILKNYEPKIYEIFGFPADARHPLPDTPALPKALTPAPHDPVEPL